MKNIAHMKKGSLRVQRSYIVISKGNCTTTGSGEHSRNKVGSGSLEEQLPRMFTALTLKETLFK